MEENKLQFATFGAGCFWGVEELFRQIKGIKQTVVGYMGGKIENPTYEDVCTDRTGHAEVVQLEYDPNEVSYEELLKVFWDNHNPTTPNQQGPDFGTQYHQQYLAKRGKSSCSRPHLTSPCKGEGVSPPYQGGVRGGP